MLARLALLLCLLAVAMAVATIAISILNDASPDYHQTTSLAGSLNDTAIGLSFALVGGLIAIKRPGHLIGWALLIAGGVGMIASNLLGAYAEYTVLARPDAGLPAGVGAWAVSEGGWAFLMLSVFLLLLRFPSGNIPSRRWRIPSLALPVAFVLIWLVLATSPTLDRPFDGYRNPLSFSRDDSYITGLYPIIGACLVCVALAAVDLLVRLWRSSGDEREQYKWLAFSAAILVICLPFAAAFNYQGINGAAISVALIALPVSVGIAILKYQLYEIDVLINRTLVYVPLTTILISLYTVVVSLLKTLVTEFSDANSDAAVALTTLLVVALLSPLRNQLQALVDRHFKEEDPRATLRKLTSDARVVTQVLDRERFAEQYLRQLIAALKARGACLWFSDSGRAALALGEVASAPSIVLPLIKSERTIGTLEVWLGHGDGSDDRKTLDLLQEAASVLSAVTGLVPASSIPLSVEPQSSAIS
ncbi:MAG TPA: hypothetical protein VFY10_14315 [Dehalococcoidia bacterium]|nr:hypothetical protein [Dehalococcoidia bacterium]